MIPSTLAATMVFVDTMFERRTPDMSTWTGRRPRGFRCNNSFQEFVDRVKKSKAGKDHLRRHHAGYTGKKRDEA